MRLNSKCLMFWRHLKVPLSLPPMSLDYLCSEEDYTKNWERTGIFMVTAILHERKILVLKGWSNRTIVIKMFLGLPESYVSYISHDEVRCVLVALNHELLLQALDKE